MHADNHLLYKFNLLGAGVNASHRGAQDVAPLPTNAPQGFNAAVIPVHEPGSVRRLIHTRVGDGPRVLHAENGTKQKGDAKESLLGQDGLPLRLQRAKRA